MTYTKGKWCYKPSQDTEGNDCFDIFLVLEGGNQFIYIGEAVDEDDAKLMASAKVMLEALMKIAENKKYSTEGGDSSELLERMYIATQAIKEATE